jgi:hypothetical protein
LRDTINRSILFRVRPGDDSAQAGDYSEQAEQIVANVSSLCTQPLAQAAYASRLLIAGFLQIEAPSRSEGEVRVDDSIRVLAEPGPDDVDEVRACRILALLSSLS